MTREFNALAKVREHVSAPAISRRLAKVLARSQKIGLGQPFKASPRSVGFRATQESLWTVEVWWRSAAGDDPSVAESAYAVAMEHLGEDCDVERHSGPGHRTGRLLVTRRREPTAPEWAALEAVAPHPLDCTPEGCTDSIPAEITQRLLWSGLLSLVKYPLVRRHVYDPYQGTLLALSTDGRKLLEDRLAHEAWERAAGHGPTVRLVTTLGGPS